MVVNSEVAAPDGTKGIYLSRTGIYVFLLDGITIKRYAMTSTWRIATAALDYTFAIVPLPANTSDYFFLKPNGSQLYLSNTDTVYQYSIKRGRR